MLGLQCEFQIHSESQERLPISNHDTINTSYWLSRPNESETRIVDLALRFAFLQPFEAERNLGSRYYIYYPECRHLVIPLKNHSENAFCQYSDIVVNDNQSIDK